MEQRHLAVSMGHHARLGAHPRCFLMSLDEPVLWMIMQAASTVSAAAEQNCPGSARSSCVA
eukprot:3716875-Rhodomonas_salina.1